jgi:hypothetical protein
MAPAFESGAGFFRPQGPVCCWRDDAGTATTAWERWRPLRPFPTPLLCQAASAPPEPPPTLSKIGKAIAPYSLDEVNDALVTVFGEISPRLHKDLTAEAEAIASTIFNRRRLIEDARAAGSGAPERLKAAAAQRKVAQADYEDLARNPSKFRKELGQDGYAKELAARKQAYDRATEAFGDAQKESERLNSGLITALSFVAAKRRQEKTITLTHIVEQRSQYEGFPKGQLDFRNFPNMSAPDQKRNLKRWETARTAVEALAADGKKRKGFVYFMSVDLMAERRAEKREPDPKQKKTTIGGNVFWEMP